MTTKVDPESSGSKIEKIKEWIERERDSLRQSMYEMDYGSFSMAKNMIDAVEEIINQ